MTMNACVEDVMTRYAVAVRRGASFKDMAARLSRFRVSAFPVIDDDGKVIGVVSETDLLTRQALALAREALADGHAGEEPREPDGLTAGDLMSQPTVTITPGESVEHAARLMTTAGSGGSPWSTRAAASSGSSAGRMCWRCSTAPLRRSARTSVR